MKEGIVEKGRRHNGHIDMTKAEGKKNIRQFLPQKICNLEGYVYTHETLWEGQKRAYKVPINAIVWGFF